VANPSAKRITVGLISDTHGLLRPEAVAALQGVHRIIHAGDIGGPDILGALSAIAPVDAVRGNNDHAPWAARIPLELTLDIAGVAVHVLHDLKELATDATIGGFHVVIAGHSHKPLVKEQDGVLYVNPGSAGPRRFKLPVAVAYLDVVSGSATARICHIL
jgi:putative phosphoesterase